MKNMHRILQVAFYPLNVWKFKHCICCNLSLCTLYIIQKRCDVLKNTGTLCFKSKSKAKRNRRQKTNIAAAIHGTFHTDFGISLFPLSLIHSNTIWRIFFFQSCIRLFLRSNLCRKIEGNRNIYVIVCNIFPFSTFRMWRKIKWENKEKQVIKSQNFSIRNIFMNSQHSFTARLYVL